jgi:hypothetical protein
MIDVTSHPHAVEYSELVADSPLSVAVLNNHGLQGWRLGGIVTTAAGKLVYVFSRRAVHRADFKCGEPPHYLGGYAANGQVGTLEALP